MALVEGFWWPQWWDVGAKDSCLLVGNKIFEEYGWPIHCACEEYILTF